MPRRGENIYKRKDGRWEGRYIKGYSQNGKAKYGYLYAHSYKGIKQKLNETLCENLKYKKEKVYQKDEKKYAYWTNKWLQSKQKAVKESTYNQYHLKCLII